MSKIKVLAPAPCFQDDTSSIQKGKRLRITLPTHIINKAWWVIISLKARPMLPMLPNWQHLNLGGDTFTQQEEVN
jgi:hypothetical protein